ncbi:tRNA pseudouridine(55) synthase TruB [Clostridioides mangenotii]|uniref:tRNA pseudouridine(55) synthase TruB n=1 Tax=Metaclostridioides mangenotii TaxID=1540 RepID=UPI001C1173BC|nr:tRNA pseudouridine(55) synthase TruB [Clostridioides mangenotii]MBU5306521.1 tRNA pseudouridine(55) synthase TruB [Clostridioides mangenotii]MCR1953694.1 tRNA pseudouridine(55) synthase TruB [Clostridioides mangenotii]
MDKVINILKPTGMTSHDVVSAVRKILNTKKVGHTGTLDPDASGVLPICVGKATKVSEFILNKDKEYLCEMTLGISTDTYDSSGTILNRSKDIYFDIDDIEKAFDKQRGEIEQFPPVYSALKVNGKRMCDLVRSGREDEIVLKSRKVNIKNLDILRFEKNKVVFKVECSKGTYVRSICHDIGEELGCGAHMSLLIRTSSGMFKLEDSITLEELDSRYNDGTLEEHLNNGDIDFVLREYKYILLNDNALKYYTNGGAIDERRFLKSDYSKEDEFVRVYGKDGFLGIGKLTRSNNITTVKSVKMFV